MPTTLSGIMYFFSRGWDEMLIEMTWNLRSGGGAHERVHPRRDPSEDIRIATLDDQADVGFRRHTV